MNAPIIIRRDDLSTFSGKLLLSATMIAEALELTNMYYTACSIQVIKCLVENCGERTNFQSEPDLLFRCGQKRGYQRNKTD